MKFREIDSASLSGIQNIINMVSHEECDKALYYYMVGTHINDIIDDHSMPSNPTTLYQKEQLINYLNEELDKLYKDMPEKLRLINNETVNLFADDTLYTITKIKTILSVIEVLVAHIQSNNITYDDYDYILRMNQDNRIKVCILLNSPIIISDAELERAIPVFWYKCCMHIADLIKSVSDAESIPTLKDFTSFDENHIRTVIEVMKLCRNVYNEISEQRKGDECNEKPSRSGYTG